MVKSYLRIGPEQAELEKKEKEKKLKRQQQHRRAMKVPKFEGIRDEAAYKIQSLWWRHANRRVYKSVMITHTHTYYIYIYFDISCLCRTVPRC